MRVLSNGTRTVAALANVVPCGVSAKGAPAVSIPSGGTSGMPVPSRAIAMSAVVASAAAGTLTCEP